MNRNKKFLFTAGLATTLITIIGFIFILKIAIPEYPEVAYYVTGFLGGIIGGPILFIIFLILYRIFCLVICNKCVTCKSYLFLPPINLKKKEWRQYDSNLHKLLFCPECSDIIDKTKIYSEVNDIHGFYNLIKKKKHFPYIALMSYVNNLGGFSRYTNFRKELEFLINFTKEYNQERTALIIAFLDWYKKTGFRVAMLFERKELESMGIKFFSAADHELKHKSQDNFNSFQYQQKKTIEREKYLQAERLNWAVKLIIFLIDEQPIISSDELKKLNRSLFKEMLPLLADERIKYKENRWPIAEIIYALNNIKAIRYLNKFIEDEDTDDFKIDTSDQFADRSRYEIAYPDKWLQFKNSVTQQAKRSRIKAQLAKIIHQVREL